MENKAYQLLYSEIKCLDFFFFQEPKTSFLVQQTFNMV